MNSHEPAPPPDVWALIAAETPTPADVPDLGEWMKRLCRAATRELLASGVGISLFAPPAEATVLAASDPVSEAIEQLQLTLGEGPCQDAYTHGRPVLIPDVAEAGSRWPGYAPALQEHGVGAVFAFPLQLGSARLGVMDVYRQRAGSLSRESLAQALTFAGAAMSVLLDAQERSGDDRRPAVQRALEDRFEVYQAQGMVQVQLGVSLAEAMVRLRGHAYAQNRPLNEVAADVVARRLVFEPDS